MKNKFDLQEGLDQFKYPTSDVDSLNLPYEVVLPFVNIDSSRIEDELTNHASKYAYLAYFCNTFSRLVFSRSSSYPRGCFSLAW